MILFSPTRCSCAPQTAMVPAPGQRIIAATNRHRAPGAAAGTGASTTGTTGYGTGAGTTG
jgi:hypothetical protein